MFKQLQFINQRPEPFSVYTAEELWNDPYTSQQMLAYHLNEELALASRTLETIERSAAWLQTRFNLGSASAIADFGCGPGLYTTRFARTGAQVTGIDFSANSIRYAQEVASQESLEIDYLQQNYLEFESTQRFDLITMIMCDFCALGPQQRAQLLGIFHKHLKDDGCLLLDVYSLASYTQRQEQAIYEFRQLNGFWSANDYYGFVNTFKYDDIKVVLDKYSLFEADRSWTIYNWLQYYSLSVLTAEFERNGFTISEVYADVTGAPFREDGEEIAVIAQKRL